MITTKKVLVAEDEPMTVFLLKRAFATARIPAIFQFVTDGQEAIDYLSGANQYADRNEYPLPDRRCESSRPVASGEPRA